MTGPLASPAPQREGEALRLVEEALDLSDDARDAFLAAAAGDDLALLEASRQLLAACRLADRDGAFMSGPAGAYAEPMLREVETGEKQVAAATLPAVVAALHGRYEFIREIGRGGSATVQLARDLKHGREVAIKVIKHGILDLGQRSRFLHEIAIAAQLRHPHIVPLLDSGESNGALYYVMPFVEGESLRRRLDRVGSLPLEEALAITRDVAEALDHAHAAGIVHRDIKPQNILLGSGHALVADFGIALALESTLADRVTEDGVAVGTPAYMSPEQATASAAVDARSDVYSLGCVVYEMLAGEVPYPGITPRVVIAKHVSAPVPDPGILRPRLPLELRQALARALAKTPGDRFRTAGELYAALSASQVNAPATSKRAPGRGGIVGAGVVAAAAAVAIWVALSGPPEAAAPRAGSDEADPRRIAVLYFDALSRDAEVGLLAQGITEDLIDELSQVSGLHVISPNGVLPYRKRSVPLDSIASSLGVGTIVGGSVSGSTSSVRASVRLIDAVTGQQLQGRSFEKTRADVLQLRDSIVSQVAIYLRERLGQEVHLRQERSETRSVRAWEGVQRAQELTREAATASRQGRERDAVDFLLRADSLYENAENLDRRWLAPILGRGWVSLSLALTQPQFLAERNVILPSGRPADGATAATHLMLRAVAHANRGLQRRAGTPEALALRGFAHHRLSMMGNVGDPDSLRDDALADLRAALDERADDARSWYAIGELYFADGRFTEALRALDRAYRQDAFLTEARSVASQAFFASLYAERFEDARTWCRLGRARYKGDPRFGTCEFMLTGWTGHTARDVAEGWRMIDAIERDDSVGMFASQWSFLRLLVAATAARAGLADSARSILRQVRSRASSSAPVPAAPEVQAHVLLLLGKREESLHMLRESVRAAPGLRKWLSRVPWFRTLHTDPRFIALVAPESLTTR